MLWLTWRQHRVQILTTATILLGIGTALLVHGIGTADVASSLAGQPDRLRTALHLRFNSFSGGLGWFALAPAAVGLFWGAPLLAREFERGTDKLAWTQSVSPRRWLLTKLAALGGLVVLAGLAFGYMVDRWVATFTGADATVNRLASSGMFVITGIVPAAWWLFAFVTGVAAGAALRRMMPAIAVTLTVVVGLMMLSFFFSVREHYATPQRMVAAAGSSTQAAPDGLLVGVDYVDAAGTPVDLDAMSSRCQAQFQECLARSGVNEVVRYQPASRYWRFQWTEAGLLLGATALTGGLGFAIARRRRS